MDKIGNICVLLLLMLSSVARSYITLEANSLSGRKITEVAAGEAFILKISTDEVEAVHDIKIAGIDAFQPQKTGLSLITVNGKKSAQISYQLQSEKPGSYTFGPAFAPGGTTQSQTVQVQVLAERLNTAQTRRNDNESDGVMLELAAAHDTVYVGQKNTMRLRAYIPENAEITIDQVVSNDPQTVDVTEKGAARKGSEQINGKAYTFLEWQWDMFAKEPGSLVIPAYFIDYAKALPAHQGFGGLALFFGPRFERKRVYSNALHLQVQPLPDTQHTVDAVGIFASYQARIQPAVAKQYEGLVLTLTIEGDGNMAAIREPILQGLPDSFKYYFSKSSVVQGSLGLQKSYEYIVQGMQEGAFEIPAQPFTFFDPEKRSYHTLYTAPLAVTVLPGSLPTVQQHAQRASHEQPEQSALVYDTVAGVDPMRGALAQWLFVFLSALPLVCGLLYMFTHNKRICALVAPHYQKRTACKDARKKIERARRQYNVRALHGIFAELEERLGVSIASVMQPTVHAVAWAEFYDTITQAAFAAAPVKDAARLFHEAEQWLTELERMV